ncbi:MULTISPECIES: IS110 family RNA-guided transposase [Chryseobacterium]|uniref:IS110 family transposase n=1 Tax=Chryseobacterium bernardetii TaxID=1241978 RepID=A0A3G6TCT9_9FLAO|nr:MULTISPECIES: IS110 family transposase [Chryseobacterium]AZB26736.1 IS110 family transposase [Chryseobacterium bernardetii]AZB27072.1 IS110 family transposase [Chryseobacterium bernardetii]AZB33476.1 IS110 family transposase [Chryseobacterium bernardetii]AZB35394.1 IS110 family transposase [Chryseobacterium bernardetii]UCA60868.1 IS110 family transposase [Chryseobacterium rhizoplanae]
MGKIIGIDISKQVFDVSFLEGNLWKHKVLSNKLLGFEKLITFIEKEDIVVMEASGTYYLPLAEYLYSQGINVVIENPLSIKRYAQSRLKRAKTDKADSKVIAEYGKKNLDELSLWNPESKTCIRIRQMHTRIQMIQKQTSQTYNQLEAFRSSGFLDEKLEIEMNNSIEQLRLGKEILESEIERLALEEFEQTIECLTSIPGIGIKTAIMLIVITDNFKKFEHHKQLIAFVGFSPRIYESGSSVRGRSSICKMGKSQIRKLLYLCSWSAKRWNKKCKEMYERLITKGKAERVAKIALANKLLKQAFAIGKNKEKYREDFC